MKTTEQITDEALTAYLDNELDADQKSSIDAALNSDPSLQARLASLQFDTADLHAAFDALADRSPPPPQLPAASKAGPSRGVLGMALSACLLLGLALGAGFTVWRDRDARGWMDYVAAYQALYVNATLSNVSVSDDETAANLAALGETLDHDLRPARADAVLSFKRGQLLGYQGKSLVQLAYLSPKGEPVALCIIRLDAPDGTSVEVTNLEGMAAAHWQKGGLAFLLIGGQDQALIREAAARMAQRL